MSRLPDSPRPRRIGELAASLGLSARTLRYWEQRALIPPAARSRCGYRLYDEEHELAARGIERLKASGLSLDDIAGLASLLGRSGTALAGVAGVRQALERQIEQLEAGIELQRSLIRELRASKGRLAHCNGCEGKTYDGQCIPCLDRCEEGADLPPALGSLLRAALASPTRTELR